MRPSLTIALAAVTAATLSACGGDGAGGSGGGTNATIQIQCSGNSDAKVAIRWSHPSYSSPDPYMPLWSVPCSSGTATKTLTVSHAASQFEIQTEGGSLTSYMVSVTVNGQNGTPNNNITITHSGEGDPVVHGNDVGITRSAGPNQYGEQNFRVTIPQGSTPNVKVLADSSGDRPDAQMALRWGHPDFHENEYFSLWTVKPGGKQEKQFRLGDQNSEFEIQTEGGTGTGYSMSIWFDFGSGFKNEPSVEISHQQSRTIPTISSTDVTFTPSGANPTGEMTVDVNAPWIKDAMTDPCGGPAQTQDFALARQPSGIYFAASPSLGASSCVNRAVKFSIGQSPYRVIFIPIKAGATLDCSAATVALGPYGSQSVDSTADQMTELFGSANPQLPLNFAACVEQGGNLQAIDLFLTYQPASP